MKEEILTMLRVHELEQEALMKMEILREAELQVVFTRLQEVLEQSKQHLRISRNPEGVAVIDEEQVALSELLARVECEKFEVLERIFQLHN